MFEFSRALRKEIKPLSVKHEKLAAERLEHQVLRKEYRKRMDTLAINGAIAALAAAYGPLKMIGH